MSERKAPFAALRRRQLDRRLQAPQAEALRELPHPRRGWIRETREALGMTATQLARRLGVTQPTVAGLEASEAEGTITLKRLRAAAAAMDCRLVYALVPESGSLEETVRRHAEEAARRVVRRVGHTMALEQQRPDDREALEQIVRDTADEMVRSLRREIWDPVDGDPARDS